VAVWSISIPPLPDHNKLFWIKTRLYKSNPPSKSISVFVLIPVFYFLFDLEYSFFDPSLLTERNNCKIASQCTVGLENAEVYRLFAGFCGKTKLKWELQG
jgi:hypothetical protein